MVASAIAAVEPEATEAPPPPGANKLEVEVPAEADLPGRLPPEKLDTPNPRLAAYPDSADVEAEEDLE